MKISQTNTFNTLILYLEKFGVQIISLVTIGFLSRNLPVDVFGVLGLLSVIISVSNLFVESGINVSILRTKEMPTKEYESAFTYTLIISLIIYIFINLASPIIANFYNETKLIKIVKN